MTDGRSAAARKYAGEEGQVPAPREAAAKAFTAAELLTAMQDLQYRLGRAEASIELKEHAENTLRAERDRLVEDLKRERQRTERLEREKIEAQRNVYKLGREKIEAQRAAEQFAREREEAREEARRLREELEAERSKGFFRRLFGR